MRLAGVELGEHELRIARGERRLGRTRILGVERAALDDASALRRLAAWRPDAVLTVCPAAAVTHRVLRLPFGGRARLLRAAPLELLGQLPVDPEGVAIACEPLGSVPGGTAVLSVVVRRTDLDAATAPLAALGLAPARVDLAPLPAWNLLARDTADVALLVADGGRSALTLRSSGQLAGLRALAADAREATALAAEVRWSLAALGGVPARIVLAGADASEQLGAELAAATGAQVVPLAEAARVDRVSNATALAAGAVAAGLVLGFGERHCSGIALGGTGDVVAGSYGRSAALALAAVFLACLNLGIMRVGLARRDAALTHAIHAEAALALPGERLVAPRAQLEAAASAATRRHHRLGTDASVLEALRELSTRVPPGVRLDLDELAIDDDGLALHGRCDSFDAVDAVRRALAASTLFADVTAEETRTTVDGRRVEFRLRAARRARTGASS
jgi:hypothetical protein